MTDQVKKVLEKMAAFDYQLESGNDPEIQNQFFGVDVQKKAFIEIDNGAIYSGFWSDEGLRQGKGKQLWPDGSFFEGLWLNDMANIRGRLIHSDGSVYEGDWVNDKAEGRGKYL